MARIVFDPSYAPCAFLVVKDGADHHEELIHTDWDWPGVASRMGWQACSCGATDGTVDCAHRTAGDMIEDAGQFIRDHAGETFPELDDYFSD